MTHRKIASDGDGRQLSKYLREGTDIADGNRALASYYGGWDARGTWRRDMSPAVARALGVNPTQAPTDDHLARLFEAKRADTGERWTNKKREVSSVDVHTAPHKSVTLAAVRAKSEAERAAILQAIWRANDHAMRELSGRLGVARLGDGGRNGTVRGEMAWCSFMHFTARPTHTLQDGPDGKTIVADMNLPSDPQIHIHNPVFNLLHCEDGELRAMDFGQLRHIKEFGGIYQAKLADELRNLGIKVRYDQNEQAVVIDCIPDEMSDLFSKGRANTLAKAKTYAQEQGLEWDDMSRAAKAKILNQAAARKIGKEQDLSTMERWEAEAMAAGWEHTTCITNEPPLKLTREEIIDQGYAFTARHIAKEFETSAVLDLEALRRWAAWSMIGTGGEGVRGVNDVVEAVMNRGIEFDGKQSAVILGMTGGRVRLTHSVQVELERSVQALATSMGQDYRRSLSEDAVTDAIAKSGITFSDDDIGKQQRQAVHDMLQGPALVYLEGVAGTGKTKAVLPPCVEAWKADGRHVIGLCQAWRQTDDLAEAGIDDRVAVAPFIAGIRDGRIKVDANTVLVVDETAQLSPRQFVELQQLWLKHGAVVRSMGDRLQCQAIEAASAAELVTRPNVLPKDAMPKISHTVRQSTREQRELATMFRRDETAEAIAYKREHGLARLVGGDYDQVVRKIADRYLELKDAATERGWNKGVAVYTLTNQDAAEISKQIRSQLQGRGEIDRSETLYRAIDNRGVQYDLPVAVGDRHRLFKKTYGFVDGTYQSVGSNGDVVEVLGTWEQGLQVRTKAGEVAQVRWSSLKDVDTGLLKMGHGHCLTIDAAQGMTASVTIHALPRGTAGETAFKAYVGESRHTEFCETLISEAAIIQAEQHSRPMGDRRPITEDDLWNRVVRDMGERPTKSLALDLLDNVLNNQEAIIDDMLRLDRRLHAAEREGRNYRQEAADTVQEVQIRETRSHWLPSFESAIHARSDVVDGLRDHMAETLRELEEYLRDDPGPDVSWINRPGVQPSL